MAEFFERHKVFRFAEFSEAHAASGAKPRTSESLLRYHVRASRLTHIRRGVYAVTPDVDPWLLGSCLSSDAVIAYDGALSFHGLWSGPFSISFLTEERTPRFEFDEIFYQPVLVPGVLRRRPAWGGQLQKVERDGQWLKVTSPERTLVDLLDRQDLGYGTRPLWDAFRKRPLDWDLMVRHAKQLESRLVVARLAVMLQFLGAKNALLDRLDAFAPRSVGYFDLRERGEGDTLFQRWNLVVPAQLLRHIDAGVPIDPDVAFEQRFNF